MYTYNEIILLLLSLLLLVVNSENHNNNNNNNIKKSEICKHTLNVIRNKRYDIFNFAIFNIEFNNYYEMINNNYDLLVSMPGYYPTDTSINNNTIPSSFNDMIYLKCADNIYKSSSVNQQNINKYTWPDRSKPLTISLIATNDITPLNFPHSLLWNVGNILPSLSNNRITAVLLLSAYSCQRNKKSLCDFNINIMKHNQTNLNECVFFINENKDKKLKFVKPPFTIYNQPIHFETIYNSCSMLSKNVSTLTEKSKKRSVKRKDYSIDYASALYDLQNNNYDDLDDDPSKMKEPISALEIKMRGILDAPIKGVVEGIANSVAQPATKIMTKPILDTVNTRLGQMTTSSMSDQLVQKLAAQITEFLSQSMPRQMATSLAAALRDSIPPALDMRVSPQVVPDVRQRIKIETTQDMARHIPPMVEEGTAEKTALYSLKPVAHILSRSLTHICYYRFVNILRKSLQNHFFYNYNYTRKKKFSRRGLKEVIL